MKTLTVSTKRARQVVDITDDVQRSVSIKNGIVHLFAQHTTVAISVADLDPGTDLDMLDAFEAMVPKLKYRHPHDPAHVPDHILSAMIGVSLTVPVRDGTFQLGTWQRIVLIEFSGPRERTIVVSEIES
ncbi:MAG: secondary thiamine-phosphate synthase enzyme YjbQ [Candidatus Kerfeldbacteria bacterium]